MKIYDLIKVLFILKLYGVYMRQIQLQFGTLQVGQDFCRSFTYETLFYKFIYGKQAYFV